jgi:hypothetical protein
MKIKDIHDTHGVDSRRYVEYIMKRAKKPIPTEVELSASPVKAEINHGRWIVRCPFCNGAEMADKTDRCFFCLSCLNKNASGKWLPVVFPDNIVEIEGVLLVRKVDNQNWRHEEKLSDLIKENKKYLKEIKKDGDSK